MSATPYELRAQLLKQAEGILMQRHQQEHATIREAMHIQMQRDSEFDFTAVHYPAMPTTEDIIDEAEKLYKFVQTK
jgi:hypothetical protein|tara:strand:- start:2647 stop:2874 length:228 start_codon:yes stop_codon:yes gene_type:complete